MMKGKNTIYMCQSQMVEAMEKYLKEHMFKDDNFVVLSVTPKKNETLHFDVVLEGHEDS